MTKLKQNLMIKVSKILKSSLWEYDFKSLNYNDEIVIIRALNFWEIKDVKIIENHIWKENIKKIFKKNLSQIDKKSQNFWKLYFNIKKLNLTNISMYDKLNKPTFTRNFG